MSSKIDELIGTIRYMQYGKYEGDLALLRKLAVEAQESEKLLVSALEQIANMPPHGYGAEMASVMSDIATVALKKFSRPTPAARDGLVACPKCGEQDVPMLHCHNCGHVWPARR